MKDRHNAQLGTATSQAKPAVKEEKKPDLRIEERILGQSWVKPIQFPLTCRDFLDKIGPRIAIGDTTLGLLNVFSNTDERAEKVVRVLHSNPYYKGQFLKHLDGAKGQREATPGVDTGIVLLGMENSRNLVIAMQLIRTVLAKHPDWDNNGKLEMNPSDILGFAIRTEDALAKRKDGFSTTAFASGLIFDYFSQICQRYCDDSKKANVVLDQVYSHGMKAGRIGMMLADGVQDFALKKYVFMGCLVHDIGKAAIAILNPTYGDFWDECRKRGLSRSIRQFAEEKRFGVSHAVLGGMICQAFSVLQPVEGAVLHHHAPYTTQMLNRNVHLLSSIIALSSNIASQLKNPDGTQDPIFSSWMSPEIRGLTVPRELIVSAAQAAIKDKD